MKQLLWEILKTYNEMAPYLFIGLFFAGILHVVFKKDFIARHLGKSNFMSVIKAAILGVPLPLCSCGVIPTALYLRRQKASEGATVSFLISTPQTGVDSIIATYGMMGPIFAIFRPLAAFITGIVGGMIMNKHTLDDKAFEKEADGCGCSSSTDSSEECDNEPSEQTDGCGCSGNGCGTNEPVSNNSIDNLSLISKLKIGFHYAFVEFLDDIALHLIFGVILAGLIAFIIPENFFVQFDGDGIGGMLIMLVIGVPLYVCATSSIPIAVSLMLKGISPGAAFVFLVVGPATNAATIALIGNTMGKKLLVVYLAVIVIFAMLGGFALNGIFDILDLDFIGSKMAAHSHMETPIWQTILMVIFTLALIPSLYRRLKPIPKKNKMKFKKIKLQNNYNEDAVREMENYKNNLTEITLENIQEYKIEGMTCNHCVNNVVSSIESVEGVEKVEVSLKEKNAIVTGKVEMTKIHSAITEAGYRVV